MKKKFLIGVTAFFVFVNASIWEGAASATVSAELPETGYYAATNSYPKYTVVEITNLENNKTVQVLVISNLDSLTVKITRNLYHYSDREDWRFR